MNSRDLVADFSLFALSADSNSHHKAARRAAAKTAKAESKKRGKAPSSAAAAASSAAPASASAFSNSFPDPTSSSEFLADDNQPFILKTEPEFDSTAAPMSPWSPPSPAADSGDESEEGEQSRALVPTRGSARSPRRNPPLKRHRMRSPSPHHLPAPFEFPLVPVSSRGSNNGFGAGGFDSASSSSSSAGQASDPHTLLSQLQAQAGNGYHQFDFPSGSLEGDVDMNQLLASHMRINPFSGQNSGNGSNSSNNGANGMSEEHEAMNGLRRLSIDDKLASFRRGRARNRSTGNNNSGTGNMNMQGMQGMQGMSNSSSNSSMMDETGLDSNNSSAYSHALPTDSHSADSLQGQAMEPTAYDLMQMVQALPWQEFTAFHQLYSNYVEGVRRWQMEQQHQQRIHGNSVRLPSSSAQPMPPRRPMLALPAPNSPVQFEQSQSQSQSKPAQGSTAQMRTGMHPQTAFAGNNQFSNNSQQHSDK